MARTKEERMNQVKQLLESTRSRRQSTVPEDLSAGPATAATPWDICNILQLQHWAQDKPNELLAMLDTIRQERDNFRDAAVGYEEAVDMRDTAQDEAYNATHLADQANILARQFQKQVTALQSELNIANFEALNNSQEEVSERRQGKKPMPDAPARVYPVATTPKSEKTSKLPDPPIFTNGMDPTWDDWSSKIEQKLITNRDHFPTGEDRKAYVINRLGGDASEHTMPRRLRNCPNPYTNHEEIMDQLSELYDNPHRRDDARREFNTLIQGSRPFIEFYSDYIRTGTILEKSNRDLLDELPERLRPTLRNAFQTFGTHVSLRSAKEYLLKLDNQQRASYNHVATSMLERTAKTTARTRGSPLSATKTVSAARTPRTPAVDPTPITTRRLVCFTCGKNDHYRRDCTSQEQTEAGKKAQQEAKLHEILVGNENDIDIYNTEPHDDSSSDSGKE